MRKLFPFFTLIAASLLLAVSCGKEPVDGGVTQEEISLMISLPTSIEGAAGDVITVKYYSGKGPKKGDVVVLKKASAEVVCQIVTISSDSFGFEIAPEVESGKYSFCIRRNNQTKAIKDVDFKIIRRVSVEEKEGYNI